MKHLPFLVPGAIALFIAIAPARLLAEEAGPELHIYKTGEVHIIGAEIFNRNAINVFTVQVWGQKWTVFSDYATRYESAYGQAIKAEEILADHRLEVRGRPTKDKQAILDARLIRDLSLKIGTPPPTPIPPATAAIIQSLVNTPPSAGRPSPAPASTPPPAAPATSSSPNKLLTQYLRPGTRSQEVLILQKFLQKNNWGISGASPVTDYYGKVTEAAVRKFQVANNLAAEGVVGPRTRELINRLIQK
ncbi:MAG: peptidoglycan-binding protein [Candidatus Sungbacteria bacterium]|nr:peptidoglycan-binding protein [Candidatus Sungbacteria bacterium]